MDATVTIKCSPADLDVLRRALATHAEVASGAATAAPDVVVKFTADEADALLRVAGQGDLDNPDLVGAVRALHAAIEPHGTWVYRSGAMHAEFEHERGFEGKGDFNGDPAEQWLAHEAAKGNR